MPRELTVREAIDRAGALCVPGRRSILGITGAPGSGKSTLAAQIATALAPNAVVVPMDGFHLANDELIRLGRRERKGAPDTFDAEAYVALLAALRGQVDQVIDAPAFDRTLEEVVPGAIPITPDVSLVITDGNYLLLQENGWSALSTLLDEIWYVETDEPTRIRRLGDRHIRHGKTPAAADAWALGTDARNATLIASARHRADAIVTARTTAPR